MACAIPLRIINPKYKKLVRESDTLTYSDFDNREDFYLDVPCGKCVNCLKSRGTYWALRLTHEYQYMTKQARDNSYFVTLTMSNEYVHQDDNVLIRRFLERIRKKYKRSVRHFIISEYGEKTDRKHFHGLLFDIPFQRHELIKFWQYGHVVIKPITYKRIGYICTYVNKSLNGRLENLELPQFHQKIFVSPGMGKAVTDDKNFVNNLRVNGFPSPFMYNMSGYPIAIPRYYNLKLLSPSELELKKLKYYANRSDDCITDGPYFIGKKRYSDYTLYQKDCNKLRDTYNKLYKRKSYSNYLKNLSYVEPSK